MKPSEQLVNLLSVANPINMYGTHAGTLRNVLQSCTLLSGVERGVAPLVTILLELDFTLDIISLLVLFLSRRLCLMWLNPGTCMGRGGSLIKPCLMRDIDRLWHSGPPPLPLPLLHSQKLMRLKEGKTEASNVGKHGGGKIAVVVATGWTLTWFMSTLYFVLFPFLLCPFLSLSHCAYTRATELYEHAHATSCHPHQ